jgi:D-alanine-D-alanine ligase
MRVGLSYDLKESITGNHAAADDAFEEYDSIETVELITGSIEACGHSVILLGGGKEFMTNIQQEKVDIVFNIAEGRGNYRSREAQIPSVLEMLDIPYSGSDPLALSVCLDKPVTKKLVETAGICTPRWLVVRDNEELSHTPWDRFPFPAIAKPAYEGSSKGIRLTSLVKNEKVAIERITELLECYHQPVMVEEFIAGDEVTAGIVGNSPPKVLGMMRVLPRNHELNFVYSLEVKRNWKVLVDYECPPRLNERTLEKLRLASIKAFEVLGCRDFARMDFRVSPEGEPYFLEINPLPGLGNHSDLVIMAIKMGWTHPELIGAVLNAALERYPQCVSR